MKFVCKRCGTCCRWEGAVKVSAAEVDAIAAFLALPVDKFIAEHTRITPDRQHLSLIENSDGACEFLTTDAGTGLACCRIDPVKPGQCREFPEKWNFPNWRDLCPGGK